MGTLMLLIAVGLSALVIGTVIAVLTVFGDWALREYRWRKLRQEIHRDQRNYLR